MPFLTEDQFFSIYEKTHEENGESADCCFDYGADNKSAYCVFYFIRDKKNSKLTWRNFEAHKGLHNTINSVYDMLRDYTDSTEAFIWEFETGKTIGYFPEIPRMG